LIRRLLSVTCLLWVATLSAIAGAQCVSLTTLGSAYTQNFDTLNNTAGSTTNNLTITGWFMTESGGGARDNEQYGVDTGASTTGDTYSYGAAGSTERALGSLRSGTLIPSFGACFTNNTGATLTNLAIAYNGEQWRLGTIGRTDALNFEYSLNATDLVTGTWTNVSALNFVSPFTATVGALNGNAAANRTALSSTISSLSIANGATFWIRWTDTDATGADDGLAVDDFSLTPSATTPINLSINDVSLNEGNAGTTSFNFTVSLSAPAGPGGVTFDIATADGTATQPSDYTQKSLTAQTIPAGSSTYSFTVLVNGDTSPETNETFFVNVTNVTGATVTDSQGQGTIVNDDAAPNLTINDVTQNEGNAGTTNFTFIVSLSAPAPAGGVTFDIATADGTATQPSDYTQKSLTGQTIPAGSSTYTFTVVVNGDTTPETSENFFVNITNITNAIGVDTQGVGTIVNDDLTKIHDVQGNGATSPMVGSTVAVEGVVIGSFQGSTKLQGFFLQEEDADADADPNTSEGIFVFCNTCPTAVAEGQIVRVTGVVSEFNGLTEITASTAGSVTVTNAGNNLALVTPTPITLPIAGDVNAFYEARESMRVTFVDTLTVSEYFELARYGTIELYQGGRPMQFTETNTPSVAGNAAWADTLSRRRVVLDDDNNVENVTTTQVDGQQFIYHPRANGGFSVGTQGTDFFRGGDTVNSLTGVLHWSFAGGSSADGWRIRPVAATPVSFTVANPRPATPPAVGGAIKAVGMNMLNYFTTIDTTSSNSTGPCGPGGTLDCRGADSTAELNRQRERASIVICTMNADVYALMEMENTTPSATITDLLGAVNTRCGGANPFAFVNTGGTLGTDAIRVNQIYRTGVLSPVGAPQSDLDPIHSRPPTAQTFDVVDATNPAFGKRFTVVANHLKSKGSSAGLPGDADIGDGTGASNATRTAQATRTLTWVNSTVIPAAGSPDVLLLGDFNSYAKEDPVTTITSGGYTDLASSLLGAGTYSYLFDGQLGHLDYAFSSASLTPKVAGVGIWHINADESDLFDYNDEVRDSPGEAAFEEKPDGSALVPPRVVFQPGTPYRASDHDPVMVGLFPVTDLSITKTDSPDPVVAGNNLTYTITVSNAGPAVADSASWSDTLPVGTTFVSMPAVAGWSCTTPAVGANGTVTCINTSFAVSSNVFTLTVAVAPTVASGTVLSNTATISSSTSEANAANNSATATTNVNAQADMSITKTDAPDPVAAGGNITYTITVANAGPSNAQSASWNDTLPIGTTFVSMTSAAGWTCTAPPVGSSGSVTCSIGSLAVGNAAFTVVVATDAATPNGTTISNTATVNSATNDPAAGNNSATATTTVSASADLSVTVSDAPDPVTAGGNITYTITVTNAGPTLAINATLTDSVPSGTTFVSLVSPAGWSCTAPAVGGTGAINCSNPSVAIGSATFTLVVAVPAGTANGAIITNTATVAAATPDPTPGNNSATATTTVVSSADLSVTLTDSPDPVAAGTNLTYTVAVSNAGPTSAQSVQLLLPMPATTTFVSSTAAAGWSCTTPAVGSNGSLNCSIASLGVVTDGFTLVVQVPAATANNTSLVATATVSSSTSDPTAGNNSATASTLVVVATMTPSFTALPTGVGAGQTLTGLAFECRNTGAATANSPTCLVTASVGTVSALSCTPSAPATLAAGAAISCTFSYTAPGTPGGSDEPATAVTFTVSTSASNVNGGATATAPATIVLIDAINDAPAPVSNASAQVISLIANDTAGSVTATSATVVASANGASSCVGCAGTPTVLTVAADGTVTVPANAVAGTYTVPYQICSTTANTALFAAACDTAIATIIVQAANMVSTVSCTPSSPSAGSTVTCTATCSNSGNAAAINATCAILNAASLPGAPTPSCPGSPAATLAAGASLTCTVSFVMPGSLALIVQAGAAADNDADGNNPSAPGNSSSAQVTSLDAVTIAVPTLNGFGLVLLALLLFFAVRLGMRRLR